jgi:hypothetical protein
MKNAAAKDSGPFLKREIQVASARAGAATAAGQEALRQVRLSKARLKKARKAYKQAKKAARKADKQSKKAEAYLQSVLEKTSPAKATGRTRRRAAQEPALEKAEAVKVTASRAVRAKKPKRVRKDSKIPSGLASALLESDPGIRVGIALEGASKDGDRSGT